MGVTEHPMQVLANYLPEGSFEPVVSYLHDYKVHLTVTRQRKSVLGDYRHAGLGGNHRISINGNLNKYEFLITLLHELAHLLTFEQYRNKVDAHGKEWKYCYSQLLIVFVRLKVFTPEIEVALQKSISNPSATANGETALLMVLRTYDAVKKEGHFTVASLQEGSVFQTDNGKIFRRGQLRRKRIDCMEIKTGLHYIFSPITVVKPIEPLS
ncbi:MAG: SprT-like domain-containing protein [Chitinophagaceae bacterium]|nr:SprT-like domain-containing protein [Chitinophagaceae bacterium]